MNKVKDFFKTLVNPVIWTIFYIGALFSILYILFEFNLFSGYQWNILLNASLTGLAGFCFGAIMFAALPLYLATLRIVIVKKEFPVNICFWKSTIFKPKKVEEKIEEKKEEKPVDPLVELRQKDIPDELMNKYLEIKNNSFLMAQFSDVKKTETKSDNDTEKKEIITPETVDSDIPLDFDFGDMDAKSDDALPESPFPKFQDLSFDELDIDDEVDDEDDDEIISNDTIDKLFQSPHNVELAEYLENNEIENTFLNDDVVLVNNLAIIVHGDSGFWVADDETWFASGRDKPSPISMIKKIAKKYNKKPAIYLAEKNIQEIEKMIAKWIGQDIIVLYELDEIKKLSEQ